MKSVAFVARKQNASEPKLFTAPTLPWHASRMESNRNYWDWESLKVESLHLSTHLNTNRNFKTFSQREVSQNYAMRKAPTKIQILHSEHSHSDASSFFRRYGGCRLRLGLPFQQCRWNSGRFQSALVLPKRQSWVEHSRAHSWDNIWTHVI